MSDIDFNHDFSPCYGQIVDVAPGIRRVVARNPSPFTGPGTGTYIIGSGEVAVIDPGPMMPEHVSAILQGLGNETVSHIIVTHTHVDHSPAARLLKVRTGAPVFGFGRHGRASAGPLEGGVDRDFEPDFAIADGEHIEGNGWQLRAIHTPGHCSNHLCFAMTGNNSLFCGDQMMAWSTQVILPPDGSVGEYLDSLDTLAEHDQNVFYPTHGRPIDNAGALIGQYRRHRLARIDQIAAAIAEGLYTLPALCDRVYPQIGASLRAGAELSLLASLEYMVENNLVKRVSAVHSGPGWQLV